jgi:autotransporter-associated beta strand protein
MASIAQAADSWWDVNGATAGSSGTATAGGNWTGSNWTADSAGSAATTTWTSGDRALFAAGANATGAYTVTVSGAQTASSLVMEEGTVTLNGGSINLPGVNPVISMNAGGNNFTINSDLSTGGGLTVSKGATAGAPFLFLGGNNSTLTGTLTIDNLNSTTNYIDVHPRSNTAFGSMNIVFSGTATTQWSKVSLDGNLNMPNNITLKGGADTTAPTAGQLIARTGTNTWAGKITLGGTGTATGASLPAIGATTDTAVLVITGKIVNGGGTSTGSGSSTWAKVGPGTVAIESNNNDPTGVNGYTGFMRHLNGILEVRSDGAFGTPSAKNSTSTGNVILTPNESGTGLRPIIAFRAPASSPAGFNYSTYEMLNISAFRAVAGTASTQTAYVDRTGIDNFGGANTFAGDIRYGSWLPTFTNQAATNSSTPVGMLLNATSGSLEISGHVYGSSSASGNYITKQGAGEIILSGDSSTNDSGGVMFALNNGTINVAGGKLTFKGDGSLAGGIGFAAQIGTTITLDNTLAVKNRIGDAAPVALNAAELKIIGNSGAAASEAVGALTVDGSSILTLQSAGGQVVSLAPTSLTRANKGTVLIRGLNNVTGTMQGSGSLVGAGTTAGSKNLGILPWGVADTLVSGGGSDFVTIADGNSNTVGALRPLAANEYGTITQNDTSLLENVSTSGQTMTDPNGLTRVNALRITGGTLDTAGNNLQIQSGALLATGNSTINGKVRFGTYDVAGGVFESPATVAEGIVHVSSGASLTINGDVKGEAGLTKSGGGTLQLTNSDNSYIGATTINGGTLAVASQALGSDASNSIVLAGGSLQGTGNTSIPHPVSLTSPVSNVIDVTGSNHFTLAGIVGSSGILTKTGTGTLALTNTNTYTGVTKINGGVVEIAAQGGVSTTQVQLGGGALGVTSSGTITNAIAVNSASNGIKVSPNQTVTFSGAITGSSNLVLNGGGTFEPTGSNNSGYTGNNLISNGSTYQIRLAAGLGNANAVKPGYWTLDNGTFRVIGTTTGGINAFAANRGLTINSGGGTVDVLQGDITGSTYSVSIAGDLSGTGALTKTGQGNFSVTGNWAHTGAINVNQGVLTASKMPAPRATGLTVADGAKMVIGARGTTPVNGNTLRVDTLNLNNNGTLDLKDNHLIVDHGNFATIIAKRWEGYRDAPDTSATGIISTAGQTITGAPILAVFDNSVAGFGDWPFGSGQTIGSTAVVGQFTYIGDADLNGQVTPDDYGAIDSNLGAHVGTAEETGGMNWLAGDWNFDGDITPDDYGGVDANLGNGQTQGPQLAASGLMAANGIAAVPEPTSLGLLGVAGAGMLMRRRRSK